MSNLVKVFLPLILAGGLAGCVGYNDGSYGYGSSGYDAGPQYYSPGYSSDYTSSYPYGQSYGYSPNYSMGLSYYEGSGGYDGGSGDWQHHNGEANNYASRDQGGQQYNGRRQWQNN